MIKIAKLDYNINENDFINAGEASSKVKKIMKKLGISPDLIKKTVVAMYEAEINAVIHGKGGKAEVELSSDKIVIKIIDEGPGIPDVNLAMQEGYSTATDAVREMGFGAGMGLPNMKKHADDMQVITKVNQGTTIILTVYFQKIK